MPEIETKVPGNEVQTYICDICGPEKPAEQVFQCTICLKDFCVSHIEASLHDCYHNE